MTYSALQRLSLSYFENRSTGEIMSRVNSDTEHVERIFIDGVEALLTASLTLVGITVMLFWLNWKLTVITIVVLGTFGVERHMLRFVGQAAHSGSTPIPMRFPPSTGSGGASSAW